MPDNRWAALALMITAGASTLGAAVMPPNAAYTSAALLALSVTSLLCLALLLTLRNPGAARTMSAAWGRRSLAGQSAKRLKIRIRCAR
jgi:hypothetical protein